MLKIGHRGAAGHEPENTMISFQRAIDMGADAIELDVQTTKDGEVIAMHDATVNRTTNGGGRVSHLLSVDIRRLRTKKRNQPIPALREILDVYQNNRAIFIEIKDLNSV